VHRPRVRLGRPDGNLVLGGAGFQLLELQFQLVEQLAAALGRLPKPLALQAEVRASGAEAMAARQCR
jgi:hypothetical protein